MPQEDLMEIQAGIADLIASRFTPEEIDEIQQALEEGKAEIERGEGMTLEQLRKDLKRS